MAIWYEQPSIELLNKRGKNTMAEWLGIEFVEVGEDYLKAIMPVNERTKQPIGILHGGANVALAETIASTAANAVVDLKHFYCVGLEINANHLRSVTKGNVVATTNAVHLGRTTQVWNILITNEAGKETCISRMTALVLKRSHF